VNGLDEGAWTAEMPWLVSSWCLTSRARNVPAASPPGFTLMSPASCWHVA